MKERICYNCAFEKDITCCITGMPLDNEHACKVLGCLCRFYEER